MNRARAFFPVGEQGAGVLLLLGWQGRGFLESGLASHQPEFPTTPEAPTQSPRSDSQAARFIHSFCRTPAPWGPGEAAETRTDTVPERQEGDLQIQPGM